MPFLCFVENKDLTPISAALVSNGPNQRNRMNRPDGPDE
jgi:hypothetical protein